MRGRRRRRRLRGSCSSTATATGRARPASEYGSARRSRGGLATSYGSSAAARTQCLGHARRRTTAAQMPATSPASQRAVSLQSRQRRGTPRHDDRAPAGQRLDGGQAEALALATPGRRRRRRAASAARRRAPRRRRSARGRRCRARPRAPRARPCSGPSPTSASEPPPHSARAVAKAASSRATFLRGMRLPTIARRAARPQSQPSAAARDLRVAVDERLQIDAGADDVQAVAERAGDCLQARAEVVRDGEHGAGVADGLQRRLADARRALGVGDVGAVRRERVGDARSARRAPGDRPRRHQVVAPDDVRPVAARRRRAPSARRAYLRSVRQPPPCSLEAARATSCPSRSRAATRRAT